MFIIDAIIGKSENIKNMDAVILNYNDHESTIRLANQLTQYKAISHVVVVDNCSNDDSYQYLKDCDAKFDLVKSNSNNGYGSGNNIGISYLIEHYSSENILICNPDISISDETIKQMEFELQRNESLAVIAPIMIIPGKNSVSAWELPTKKQYIFSLGIILARLPKWIKYDSSYASDSRLKKVGCVAGSLFAFNSKRVNLPLFDENIFLYCEETVLGLLVQKNNKEVALLCDAQYEHLHSTSISKAYSSLRKRHKLMINSKMYVLQHYYNINFLERVAATIITKLSLIELYLFFLVKRK